MAFFIYMKLRYIDVRMSTHTYIRIMNDGRNLNMVTVSNYNIVTYDSEIENVHRKSQLKSCTYHTEQAIESQKGCVCEAVYFSLSLFLFLAFFSHRILVFFTTLDWNQVYGIDFFPSSQKKHFFFLIAYSASIVIWWLM